MMKNKVFNCHCLNTWRGDRVRTNEVVNSFFNVKVLIVFFDTFLKKKKQKHTKSNKPLNHLFTCFQAKYFGFLDRQIYSLNVVLHGAMS